MTRLTADGVGELLGVDRRTVSRWARQGRLPFETGVMGKRTYDAEVVRSLMVVDEAIPRDPDPEPEPEPYAYRPTPAPGHGLLWLV